MLRPRRRGIASVNAEVRDGIVPAGGSIAMTPDMGAPAASRNYRLVALIIASALFMEFVDATVLATALPTMARDFGVRAQDMSVALTSYLLALAIFIPASGTLADRFGSRTVFRTAIVLFTLGSLACGQSPTLEMIVVSRFVQGIGGAMMIPVGRLVLLRSVAKQDMVSAMSWLLVPALIGPIIGPPLGGFIVTYLDWRWIFYINLPMGVLGLWLTGRFIANVREERPNRFDVLGFVLSGIALGCLLFGFEMASRPGREWISAGLVAIGIVAGLSYITHAKRREGAILDLSLLKDDTFRLSVIAGSLTRITQGAQPFLLPLMMQVGFGFTAARSGTITVATAIGSLAMKSFAPRILRRFGFRRALIANGFVATAGYAVCGLFRPDWPTWAMFGVLMLAGFFMSFQFTAYNTIAYDGIDKRQMSSATAFYSTFQQLMLSLGICIAAVALHLATLAHGHETPTISDFSSAFWVVTAISLSATIWNLRFAPHAGTEISGHSGQAIPARQGK
ncbi:EmrB/QacA subfamily drug resistance transporter [Novosphingobium sp. PhB165]|uniref:DHA2 family efflux MFS transporter permease subunit n=1 Tax=Novosphingobium sp. PhB165 TaxID=2485105 RepID=UPI001044BF8A|nr:DHA2 family efflux MFS transporter permease subunit [Novosphingobium sp. PhB165]TCM15355.1 EmrB/QacA subfamily drug resistance transporter [Novosphingobium sp. PhB165]